MIVQQFGNGGHGILLYLRGYAPICFSPSRLTHADPSTRRFEAELH
jgi:hypothetical protein